MNWPGIEPITQTLSAARRTPFQGKPAFFPRRKAARACDKMLTTYLHLVPRLIFSGVMPLFLLCVFMARTGKYSF